MFVMHSSSMYSRARQLIATGMPDGDIARLVGVPTRTVRTWRRRGSPRHERRAIATSAWRPRDEPSYSYLLGLYLGDGHITRRRTHAPFLRLTLDLRYELILAEATGAIEATLPVSVRRYKFDPGSDAIVLQASHPAWPFVFPQHGPGRKHDRPIVLVDWQRAITQRHPEPFIRGLTTPTAVAPSTGSRPSCRAGASRTTSTSATSSRICRRTYAGSSASTATCSGSAGRSRTRATSRSPTATPSRSWKGSSGRSPRRV
jgi:hypothetical protein